MIKYRLFDLGFSGYEFTWANRRYSGELVEEQLDRFCASAEWMALFSYFKVSHLDKNLSDHLPILLDTFDKVEMSSRSKRTRKFEVMSAEDPRCEEIITSSWNQVGDIEAHWLKSLLNWNVEEFANVQKHIGIFQHQIKQVSDAKKRAEVLRKIQYWRHKKEILWWEWSQIDFLKFGYQNSNWFHSKASA
ncbi:hypothetical protein Cgig2_030208 [Carnegiea gigantea]|uniref:Endonuclease/exonuclease/phosphatase domain-containing protein n=1 Tax=Carnegiea gigantea TaxID=171969 RepID=A0A9Q1QEE2_9CARY|nr:hypothetical protein Cgig2_030208 [Carnegiea gigantea]